ncbi:unnamed protein product [Urochloa decumbens]|uniref:Uncharacterized protein n=1 Tax=Urochloa decumbens TaxID=240449 RepID=A0ABC9EEV7_9POAL
MSSDDVRKRLAKCCEEFDSIFKQFPVLLEKLDALDPPKKRTRRAAKKKKTEAEKSDDRPTLTPEIRARYKEMGVVLEGFLNELGDDVDGASVPAAGGSTSLAQAAPPPPPPAAGDKQ